MKTREDSKLDACITCRGSARAVRGGKVRTILSRAVLVILLVLPVVGWARSKSSSVHVHGYTTRSGHYVAPYTRSAPHTYTPSAPASPGASTSRTTSLHSTIPRAVGVTRASHGHIKRSEGARLAFEHHHPCPSTGKTSGGCPGYVIDHVVPLKRGGADDPSNMQWQTTGAAKAKDRWE